MLLLRIVTWLLLLRLEARPLLWSRVCLVGGLRRARVAAAAGAEAGLERALQGATETLACSFQGF